MKKLIIIFSLVAILGAFVFSQEFRLDRLTTDMTREELCGDFRTSSIRPPVSVTNKIKLEMISELIGGQELYLDSDGKACIDKKAYELVNPKNYQLDHIIPLCLAGEPLEPNLQLQPIKEAREKDKVERYLCLEICKGADLRTAQRRVLKWDNVNLGGFNEEDTDDY